MLTYVSEALDAIENDATVQTREAALTRLRTLSLDDFNHFLVMLPHRGYPKLSSLLPKMASVEVQQRWTGNQGYELVKKTCAFARLLTYHYYGITGKSPSDATILDFGCGYGRIARAMFYFVEPENVVGVDPMPQSIEECRKADLGPNFFLSDHLPTALPTDRRFDLGYAFSVFTHLSERAVHATLSAIRKSMNDGGLLCITIRPPDFWNLKSGIVPDDRREEMKTRHRETGFAFTSFPKPDWTPDGGEPTFGDASMTLDWIDANVKGWRRVALDHTLEDPYQLFVFLAAE